MNFFKRSGTDTLKARYETLVTLTKKNTATLAKSLDILPEKRTWGLKPDGSEITTIDYAIGVRSLHTILKYFPQDSIYSEETPLLRPNAKWEFQEDPVDVTSDARQFNKLKPSEFRWASYMASYLKDGIPLAFGFSTPARNEMYYGSTEEGIFLNRKKFTPPEIKHDLIIGLNEHDYGEHLKKIIGFPHIHLAAPSAWLAAQKAVGGGVHSTRRPYELHCILAIAKINGATITDEKGNNYRHGTDAKYAVWTYEHINHQEVLSKIPDVMKRYSPI